MENDYVNTFRYICYIIWNLYFINKKHSLLKNTALLKNQKQYFLNEAIVFFYWGIILILYNFVNHYTNFHTTEQILFYILLLLGLLFRIKNNNDHYK